LTRVADAAVHPSVTQAAGWEVRREGGKEGRKEGRKEMAMAEAEAPMTPRFSTSGRVVLTAHGYAVEAVEQTGDHAAAVLLALDIPSARRARRSVVVYEATTRRGLSREAPGFFAAVAHRPRLRCHAFVLRAADVEDLPDELRALLGPLDVRALPFLVHLRALLKAVATAAATAARAAE